MLVAAGFNKPNFQGFCEGFTCSKQFDLLKYWVTLTNAPHWPGRLTERAPVQRNETVTSDSDEQFKVMEIW